MAAAVEGEGKRRDRAKASPTNSEETMRIMTAEETTAATIIETVVVAAAMTAKTIVTLEPLTS